MGEMIAIRDAYGDALAALGAENDKVVVLDADVSSSTKSSVFAQAFPDRFFNIGIAEVDMVAIAAGLAYGGLTPFANAFAVFLASRALDPVNSLICYDRLNVKLAGNYCGLSDSYDGASHQAVSDLAIMRSLPNMTIVSPCDAVETASAVRACAAFDGPVYLRLGRAPLPIVLDRGAPFELGRGVVLREGGDVTVVATGCMVEKALRAADLLDAEGIDVQVVNIHTIKPLDRELILSCAAKTGAIVTAEEHNIVGGLGGAVAELLAAERPTPVAMVGMTDRYAESGDYDALLERYGLTARAIAAQCRAMVNRQLGSHPDFSRADPLPHAPQVATE